MPGREKICRTALLYPSAGERYYLRMLLLHTAPTSFLAARVVGGKEFPTYQEACDQSMVLTQMKSIHTTKFPFRR